MVQNTAEVQSSQLSFAMADKELKEATQDEIGDQLEKVLDRISEVQEKMGKPTKSLQGPSQKYDDDKATEKDLVLLTEELVALRAYQVKLNVSWHQKEKLDRAS